MDDEYHLAPTAISDGEMAPTIIPSMLNSFCTKKSLLRSCTAGGSAEMQAHPCVQEEAGYPLASMHQLVNTSGSEWSSGPRASYGILVMVSLHKILRSFLECGLLQYLNNAARYSGGKKTTVITVRIVYIVCLQQDDCWVTERAQRFQV